MMPGKRMALAAVLGATMVTGFGAAQDEAAQSFSEVVEVELVNVEVWATDGRGRFVGGLTADDFVLLHDGEETPIDFFSEIRQESVVGAKPMAEAQPTGGGEAEPVRSVAASHLIVYFDELNLHPSNRRQLIDALRNVLSTTSVPVERILLLRQGFSLFVESPFGSSRAEIEAALKRLSEAGPASASAVTAGNQARQEVQEVWRSSEEMSGSASDMMAAIPGTSLDEQPGGPGGSTSPSATVGGVGSSGGLSSGACDIFLSRIEPVVDGFARERRSEVVVTLERLAEAVTFLSGLDGVKFLLYLSDRLETSPGADLASMAQAYCPTGRQSYVTSAMSEELTQAFFSLTRHANANRVTLYALQGQGLRSGGSGSASERRGRPKTGRSAEAAARANERGGLIMLAGETGGRAIYNRSDFEDELQDITQEMGTYYSLAYRPPPSDGNDRHTIEIKTKDGSINTRYRKSYRDKSLDDRLAERLLGALNLGLVANPLDIRLGAGDIVPGEGGMFSMPLQILIPAERLTFIPTAEGPSAARITLKLTIHDAAVGSLVTQDGNFRVPRPQEVAGQWVPLGLNLNLPKGVHSLAVGIRDGVSGEVSVISTSVNVGEAGVGGESG